jgi:DNA-binding CsgD family transcriptional regulator
MVTAGKPGRVSGGRALRGVLLFGLAGGASIAVLKLAEYRFLVVEHAVEVYVGVVAALCAGLGIWLGRTLVRRGPAARAVSAGEAPAAAARASVRGFVPDADRLAALAITPRELEILGLIAAGLSNREIAGRLGVSENTVKTHSSRLFDKLGASRRTQAVQIGQASRLIP